MALLLGRCVGYAAAHIIGLRICMSCWRGSALNAVIKVAGQGGWQQAVRQAVRQVVSQTGVRSVSYSVRQAGGRAVVIQPSRY